MTPNEINEVIAKSLGWTDFEELDDCMQGLRTGSHFHRPIPDYWEDLNACAEFEASLTQQECWNYDTELHCSDCGFAWKATAAQRCEAYLKLKGLWCE